MIATMMRVKNEEKYLAHALDSLKALDAPIILLDDGSSDSTPDICDAFTGELYYFRQDGLVMDEGRDRTFIYREALRYEPDWLFTLDGDEVLDADTADRMTRAVENCPDEVNVFEMFLAVMQSPVDSNEHLWLGPMEPQGAWSMDRMLRVRDADPEHQFTSTCAGNLHCGCTPKMTNYNKQKLDAWIRYYGYESATARERKHAFYSTHDPKNFPSVSRLWKTREPMRPYAYPRNMRCGELGITKTVHY